MIPPFSSSISISTMLSTRNRGALRRSRIVIVADTRVSRFLPAILRLWTLWNYTGQIIDSHRIVVTWACFLPQCAAPREKALLFEGGARRTSKLGNRSFASYRPCNGEQAGTEQYHRSRLGHGRRRRFGGQAGRMVHEKLLLSSRCSE